MSAVLKITFEEEMRRVALPVGQLQYSDITDAIRKVWPELVGAVAKYTDEEGDSCVLCQGSFTDFIDQASETNGTRIYRLTMSQSYESNLADCFETVAVESCGFVDEEADDNNPQDEEFVDPLGDVGADAPDADQCNSFRNCIIRKLHRILSQMRIAGVLNGLSMAAIVVNKLPSLIEKLALLPDIAKSAMDDIDTLRLVLLDLSEQVSDTVGFSSCKRALETVRDGGSVAEALLATFTELLEMPVADRLNFLEVFFALQSDRIGDWLDSHPDTSGADLSNTDTFHHPGVVCDGCGSFPLTGPRFTQRGADFDLCVACYANDLRDGGKTSEHSFDMLLSQKQHQVDWSSFKGRGKCGMFDPCAFKGKGKCGMFDWCGFKGKGSMFPPSGPCKDNCKRKRGKDDAWNEFAARFARMHMMAAKGKGKCIAMLHAKGKGKGKCQKFACRTAGMPTRECANGCGLQATWHERFCCKACKHGKGHGKWCDHCPMPKTSDGAKDEDVKCDDETCSTASMEHDYVDVAKLAQTEASHSWNETEACDADKMASSAQCDQPATEKPSPLSELASGLEKASNKAVELCPGGCGYLVTWHATHCCAACKRNGKHGPRCERVSAEAQSPKESEQQ